MLSKIKKFIKDYKYHILASVSIISAGYFTYLYLEDSNQIKLSAFLQALEKKKLSEVIIKGTTIYFRSDLSEWYHTNGIYYPTNEIFNKLKNSQTPYACQNDQSLDVLSYLSIGLTLLMIFVLYKNIQMTNNNHHKKILPVCNDHFQDFYGGFMLKYRLQEVVDFLKNPQKYQKKGARLRRGILIYGPPGTGKTMLARALANECKLDFISCCASEFQELFVGVGAKRIRALFQSARQCKNGCIVFIDELDSIGSRHSSIHSQHQQTNSTINQLLTEIDGFCSTSRIILIGASNRIDIIDPALIRAGRFDLKIQLKLPTSQEKFGIFKTILKKKMLQHIIDNPTIQKVSMNSQNWSGAQIENLINQSIYCSIRQQHEKLENSDVLQAFHQLKSY